MTSTTGYKNLDDRNAARDELIAKEQKDVWVVDIAEGLIRQAVITPFTQVAGWGSTGPDDDTYGWSISYRVPDRRIRSEFPSRDLAQGARDYWIRSEDVRKFPKFWKVTGLRWVGESPVYRSSRTELVKRCWKDGSVTRAIMDSNSHYFTVTIDHGRGCWVLSWNTGWSWTTRTLDV